MIRVIYVLFKSFYSSFHTSILLKFKFSLRVEWFLTPQHRILKTIKHTHQAHSIKKYYKNA